ncbi:unnamed protein product [Diabrotica balteata]|uniref:Uncharacterized protein n=1 Tax=Diabrotica balteata TaxID=107213 RepID=A0A9N9SRC9_DIABA|nr:unnamed protein product [Diabrotica balteata]
MAIYVNESNTLECPQTKGRHFLQVDDDVLLKATEDTKTAFPEEEYFDVPTEQVQSTLVARHGPLLVVKNVTQEAVVDEIPEESILIPRDGQVLKSLYYFSTSNSYAAAPLVITLRSITTLYMIIIITFYLILTNWLNNRYEFMIKYLKTTLKRKQHLLVIRKVIVAYKIAESVVETTNHLFGSILFINLTVSVLHILHYFVLALDLSDIPTALKTDQLYCTD